MIIFQSVGWSALFYAVSGGYLEITQLLIAANADVLLKDKVLFFLLLCKIVKHFFLKMLMHK